MGGTEVPIDTHRYPILRRPTWTPLIEEAAFAADMKPPIVVMAALETSSRRVVEGTTKDGNTTYPMWANKAHRMSTENALEDAMGQMSIVFFSDNFVRGEDAS